MMLRSGVRRHVCRLASIRGCRKVIQNADRKLSSLRSHILSQRDVFGRHRHTVVRNLSALSTSPSDKSESSAGLYRLLNEEERKLLEEQRSLTERARWIAQQVGISARDFSSHSVLEDYATFCVVIAGEFNAGKSTVVNALLGEKLLETGSLPTTDAITILSHAEPPQQYPSVLHHQVDLPLLHDLTLVDTPGTNAVLADHTAKTLRLLPSADLILFVTSADRPFPESERALLESISAYRKAIVVVINKMDVLEQTGGHHGQREKERVVEFVTEHASELLGARPIVLPVSARDALSAKLMHQVDSKVWKRSNFGSLESFLKDSLTTETKIKSKLTSPIGVAEGLLGECLSQLKEERAELEMDIATLNLLRSQFKGWRKELSTDMERARNEMNHQLRQEGNRCQILLRRMSWAQYYYWTLLDTDKLQREWDKTQPIFTQQGLEAALLDMVRETADSIATRGRAQGQAVIEFLGKRPAVKNQSLVGSVTAASRFEDTRQSLLDHMSEAVQRNIDADPVADDRNVMNSLQRYAYLSTGLNVAAIGSAIAVAAQLVDIFAGMAVASTLAISSGLIISSGQKQVAKQYSAMWASRSQNLEEALQAICAKELDRVDRHIRDGVAPYTRFVEAEQERIDELIDDSEETVMTAHRLRNRISKLR